MSHPILAVVFLVVRLSHLAKARFLLFYWSHGIMSQIHWTQSNKYVTIIFWANIIRCFFSKKKMFHSLSKACELREELKMCVLNRAYKISKREEKKSHLLAACTFSCILFSPESWQISFKTHKTSSERTEFGDFKIAWKRTSNEIRLGFRELFCVRADFFFVPPNKIFRSETITTEWMDACERKKKKPTE